MLQFSAFLIKKKKRMGLKVEYLAQVNDYYMVITPLKSLNLHANQLVPL